MFRNRTFKVLSDLLSVFVVVMVWLFLPDHAVHAAPIDHYPITVTQPDGTQLQLFVSGDEFYTWMEDAQGYTVIHHPDTGYYVYANLVDGKLVPTDFLVGQTDLTSASLSPQMNISPEQIDKIQQAYLN